MSAPLCYIERLPLLDTSGAECRVYELGPRTLLKVYSSPAKRDRCYARQRRAHRAGVGPATHGKRDYLKRGFGYVTSRAESVEDPLDRCDYWEVGTLETEEFQSLQAALRHLGFAGDICARNLGRWQGRAVAIDFGDYSESSQVSEPSSR